MTKVLGSWERPVVYFSKLLDEMSKGWLSCLRAVAVTVLLVREARKLTLGQLLMVFATLWDTVETNSLPRNTSAQTAELF